MTSELTATRAKALIETKPLGTASEVANAIPGFTLVSLYSFRAEWAVIGTDLQFHFFLPKQAEPHMADFTGKQKWMEYWLKDFPTKLDPVAKAYFECDHPRLVAKWTEELASWWLKAAGFSSLIDPKAFAEGFLRTLDEALRSKSS